MSEREFVESTWGKKAANKLDRIRQGGDNNDKGNRYETSFATFLFAKYKAEKAGADVRISSQELAFVDDICVRLGGEKKLNYQAKNSSGNAAAWNGEMEERFIMQQEIDTSHYGFGEAGQVLLVSSDEKRQSNERKIPAYMSDYASCEFFPFCEPAGYLLIEHPPVLAAFSEVCGTDDYSRMDVAFRALRSQWIDVPAGSAMLVDELIENAKQEAKPNVFRELDGPEPPEWLHELLEPFRGAEVNVQSGGFNVQVKGTTKVWLPGALATKSKEEAIGSREIDSELQLIGLLFELSTEARL